MMHQSKKAFSRISNIKHVSSLARVLDVECEDLLRLSRDASQFWRPGKILYKANGEPRYTNDAKWPLKQVHEKIKNRLLKRVDYPFYLLGGISDKKLPRDYKRHADIHSGKKILISEDIANFFPSTTPMHIHGIWQGLFNFHPDIAELLTNLTTYDGMLPQGWKTSGYLANLVFWNTEPDFVSLMNRQGYAYSRFMDDVTVSSSRKLSQHDKRYIVSAIYRMLFQKHYMPRRDKHDISSSACKMEVTGLIVNSGRPTLQRKKRDDIRGLVYACRKASYGNRSSPEYYRLYSKASAKVGELSRFHRSKATKYREILRSIKPI